MPRQMMMLHPDDEDGDEDDGGDGNICDYDGDLEVEHATPVVFHLSALVFVIVENFNICELNLISFPPSKSRSNIFVPKKKSCYQAEDHPFNGCLVLHLKEVKYKSVKKSGKSQPEIWSHPPVDQKRHSHPDSHPCVL